MADWPQETTMEAFKRAWTLEGEPFWSAVFSTHQDKMKVKNPKVAIVNLEKIITATFKLANAKGFQAMSLRDLSRETGISMGGVYAYIGSKNDLASVIEGVLRAYIDRVIGELVDEDLDPVDRLQQPVNTGQIRLMTCLYQLMGQPEHRRLGLQRVLERPETYTPGGELRFGLRVLIQLDKAGQ